MRVSQGETDSQSICKGSHSIEKYDPAERGLYSHVGKDGG